MTGKTSLGDRMKSYEALYAQKCMPLLPIIARLDGRAFHTWTKGLDRPFDQDMMHLMQKITEYLLEGSGALLGYTQSDEITLIFYSDDPKSQVFFDGKVQKMCSVLASLATAGFNYAASMSQRFRDKPLATFDCRIFQVPSLEEAVNCLIWREQDAVRNSILAVAQSKFSHLEMQSKSCAQLQEMLWQEHKINWGMDYSSNEKRGTYYKKVTELRPFTAEEIEKLPEKHEARANPLLVVARQSIKERDYPILTKIANRVEVIFGGQRPILKTDSDTELDSDIAETLS